MTRREIVGLCVLVTLAIAGAAYGGMQIGQEQAQIEGYNQGVRELAAFIENACNTTHKIGPYVCTPGGKF